MIEQVLNRRNVMQAYRQVMTNKGSAGMDGMSVQDLYEYLSENGVLTDLDGWLRNRLRYCIWYRICGRRNLRRKGEALSVLESTRSMPTHGVGRGKGVGRFLSARY